MRAIIELPEYLVREARKLIGEGRYSDLSSFIVASIENQLTLEKSDIESGTVLVKEGAEGWGDGKSPSLTTQASHAQGDYSGLQAFEYPEWKGRGEEDWLWGQINKVLPIKFVLRLLANEMRNNERPPLLEEFTKSAAAAGRAFGLGLEKVDEREEHAWGERLSTAFPISDKVDRALARFGSQFVGYVGGDGQISGALVELKFGNIIGRDGDARIGLTQAGLQLAQLTNPVLDERDYSRPLSEEEIDFYLDHITRRVPWEAAAFKVILSILADGITGREEVNREITNRLSVPWSKAHVNTERAGSMARMFQLGLLDRERDGIKVEYKVTERGMRWQRNSR